MLKIGEIRELIRLVDETSVAELKIELEGMKLSIRKADAMNRAPVQPPVYVQPHQTFTNDPGTAATILPRQETNNAPVNESDEGVHIISSPMVGTFYSAPAPDSAPFVQVGGRVTEKSVVCIIEAMKLMNEIEAEVNGEVIEVLVNNGQLVEYGQPLFRIRVS